MVETISIAGGQYRIGHDSLTLSRPVHDVAIQPFKIMVGTVTNQAFAAFVGAGGYRQDTFWSQIGVRWRNSKTVTMPAFWGDGRFDGSAQPVVGVSWYAALAYAAWLSAETGLSWRLPREVEWEVAAQGGGEGVICHAGNSRGQPIAAIGAGHQVSNGAWNLLGNVWEWCSTRWGRNWQSLDYRYPYDATDGREDLTGSHARVMRGGSWFDALQEAHPSKRARYLPGSRGSNIGFRLVQDVSV